MEKLAWNYPGSTKQEADKKKLVKRVEEERKWWSDLTEYLPWELHSWTNKSTATFTTKGRGLLQLTGDQKVQIIEAIRKGREGNC